MIPLRQTQQMTLGFLKSLFQQRPESDHGCGSQASLRKLIYHDPAQDLLVDRNLFSAHLTPPLTKYSHRGSLTNFFTGNTIGFLLRDSYITVHYGDMVNITVTDR